MSVFWNFSPWSRCIEIVHKIFYIIIRRTWLYSKAFKKDNGEPRVVSLKLNYDEMWGFESDTGSWGWRPLFQMGMRTTYTSCMERTVRLFSMWSQGLDGPWTETIIPLPSHVILWPGLCQQDVAGGKWVAFWACYLVLQVDRVLHHMGGEGILLQD